MELIVVHKPKTALDELEALFKELLVLTKPKKPFVRI